MKKLMVLIITSLLVFTSSIFATGLPAPQDTREFFIDEAQLPFDAFPDPRVQTDRRWGVLNGAAYRLEVPANWNGELVMWAHGFFGNGEQLFADTHPLRLFLISQGYAWAASSYTKNYYDVRSGVQSTNDLVRFFKDTVAEPTHVFITGASMGGHVTAAAVEQFPNYQCREGRSNRLCKRIVNLLGRISGGVKYSGAVPVCGVMGDKEGLSYGVNYRLVAEQLAGASNEFPTNPDYLSTTFPFVLSQLFTSNGLDFPNGLTAKGEVLKDYLRYSTGGERPGFDQAFAGFQETVFGSGLGDGTFSGVTGGNTYDNRRTIYQLDADPQLSQTEYELNQSILRVKRDRRADPRRFLRLERIPTITGRISVPVVSLHTLGDLRVPFSNQQIYARRVAAHGRSDFLVQRAIRDVGHCTFDPIESVEAFLDMRRWVATGEKPFGDDVLTPELVSDENYGCNFTRRTRSELGFAECPAPGQ